ncbi:hypothetical protein cypCar_00014752 [Cyprinus carpio]|nr:hypothetical protein cypCar_00014752 [Cyprinus carpio]
MDQVEGESRMGKKDASSVKLPVDQYRKQIGLRRSQKVHHKAEETCESPRGGDIILVIVAVLVFLLVVYAFFYLNLSTELDLDVDMD